MRVRGKDVILAFVLFIFGFLVAFSFQQTKYFSSQQNNVSEQQWEQDFYYRQQLIELEEKNYQIQTEISEKRQKIFAMETELSEQMNTIEAAFNRKTELQILTGELPVSGSGIFITLRDSDYVPLEGNINDYIVHDRHVQLVINELFSAGAEAIAINGQRIYSDSYVNCVGPVISVDGVQYPEPFTIEAIGDQDTLQNSLTLDNGVVDILVNDQVEVEVGKRRTIEMEARSS